MKRAWSICSAGIFFILPALAQDAAPKKDAPIYHVTVIERNAKAINYQYLSGPTMIDFRGTVLLPEAKGEATVESKRGRTEIDAKLEKLVPPARFGRGYLTYTLWAITPEGAARNLGEIVPSSSDKAHLHVTTDLQAFGLIVTAEPYSATRLPSDVVVMENEIRPETVGKIQEIHAKYELMPRGHYTWESSDKTEPERSDAPKVSMSQYEALLQLYEAQSATDAARAAKAEQYAPQTFQKAMHLLEHARQLQASKGSTKLVVQDAREAAQTAEDARMIAERRHQEDELATANDEVNKARRAQAKAQAEAQEAKTELARFQGQGALPGSQTGSIEPGAPAAPVVSAQDGAPPARPQPQTDSRKTERGRLLEQLNGVVATRDTPRGLVATLADSDFNGSDLCGQAMDRVSRIAMIAGSRSGLRIDIEGYTDNASSQPTAQKRAETVRRILERQGFPANRTSAQGLGDSRPVASNSGAAGRVLNRRVEIVISGDSIGTVPFWDHAYSLVPRQ
jgi:flagellar motor protein MotB